MIDTATFKQMHPPGEGAEYVPNRDDLGSEIMSQDEPDLSDDFFMCLPTTLSGFNMQKKEWGQNAGILILINISSYVLIEFSYLARRLYRRRNME